MIRLHPLAINIILPYSWGTGESNKTLNLVLTFLLPMTQLLNAKHRFCVGLIHFLFLLAGLTTYAGERLGIHCLNCSGIRYYIHSITSWLHFLHHACPSSTNSTCPTYSWSWEIWSAVLSLLQPNNSHDTPVGPFCLSSPKPALGLKPTLVFRIERFFITLVALCVVLMH